MSESDRVAMTTANRDDSVQSARPRRRRLGWALAVIALVLTAVAIGAHWWLGLHPSQQTSAVGPPHVVIGTPLLRTSSNRTNFLGQFSAVNEVEIRAQVGGLLSEIHFVDGQIVHQGELLFVIDRRP
jgi:multidrug efflux system membrane fusion protein